MVTELNNERLSQERFDQQAQAFYDASPLKNIPHWHITIRPTAFDENYIIKDFPKYFEKIKSFSNDWGVWDYPYVDLGPGCYNRDEGKDWIQSWYNYDILGLRQCWRFYRSGLFVHLRSFLEEDESRRKEAEKQTTSYKGNPSGYIGIISVIHTTTKLFDFVGQLAQDFKDSTFFVEIKMPGVENFLLYKDDKKPPACIWACQAVPNIHILPIKVYKTSSDELDKLAREAAVSIFKRFDLNNISSGDFFKANITEERLKKIQKDLRSGYLT